MNPSEFVTCSWERLVAMADERRALAPARVARFEWAVDEACPDDPHLLWSERSGRASVTKFADKRPSSLDGKAAFGYAADGVLVMAERFEERGGVEVAVQQTVIDTPLSFEFTPRGQFHVSDLWLERVHNVSMDADRPALIQTRYSLPGGRYATDSETYHYGPEGRLTEIWRHTDGLGEEQPRTRFKCRYDAAGKLGRVEQAIGHQPPTVVFRRPISTAVPKARRTVSAVLPELVTAWVRRHATEKASQCVAIEYGYTDPTSSLLAFALGTEDERRRLQKSFPSDPRELWRPINFNLYDDTPAELGDPVFADAWETLSREWQTFEDWEDRRQLLVRIAKALNKQDWSDVAGAAPGLVVYPIGDGAGDLDENLQAVLPGKKRREFEQLDS